MANILKPARGMVLVKPCSIQSNLPLPDTAFKDLQSQFLVVAVGKGRIKKFKKSKRFMLLFPEMRVGDKCLINTWAGTPLNINGVEHRLVHQDSVMAVLYDEGVSAERRRFLES